jgi:hypothetical protein
MIKPLLRWTIGDSSPVGLEVFDQSLYRAKLVLGDKFDYIVCSNAKFSRYKVEKLASQHDIRVMQMSWEDYPLPPETCQSDPTHRQGSFWKICPPRLRLESHEIIMDNDIILMIEPPQFREFLQDSKPMITEEDCIPYGKYYKHVSNKKGYNSGIIGLPPNFDFKSNLVQTWEDLNSMTPLKSWDEQGLIGATLGRFPLIVIPSNVIIPLLKGGMLESAEYGLTEEDGWISKKLLSQSYKCFQFTYTEYGYHFCEINRLPTENYPYHLPYCDYRTGKLI